MVQINYVAIEHVMFKAESTGYSVLSCSTDDLIPVECINNSSYPHELKNAFIAIITDLFNITETVDKRKRFNLVGHWETSKYGWQFRIDRAVRVIGSSEKDIREYLSEIRGIGPKTSKRIYDLFGNESITIVKEKPEQLLIIKGISRKKVEGIVLYLQETEAYNKVVDFFSVYAISLAKIKSIYTDLGLSSIEIAKKDPFGLCDSTDLVFPDANAIALALNIGLISKSRIFHGILYTIERMMNAKGHLFLLENEIIAKALYILNKNAAVKTTEAMVKDVMNYMTQEGTLKKELTVKQNVIYYLFDAYINEKYTANKLVDFLHYPGRKKVDEEKLESDIKEAEKQVGIQLSEKQSKAVKMAINSGVSVITGGPGTGKSTILSVLIKVFEKNFSKNISLCAPTGRAARRMAETTGYYNAATIHNLLGIREDYDISSIAESINSDLIIIDEASMIDMRLMHVLIMAIPYACRIVFVGDADQLPSVSPGNVLRELINSNLIPTTYLDVIYRQAGLSRIIENADKIKRGNINFSFGDDFRFTEMSKPTEIEDEIIKTYICEYVKYKEDPDKVQILTPYKSLKVPCSTWVLNDNIQNAINPKNPIKREIKVGKTTFRVNDRVIQQINTDDAKNGDIGKIISIYNNEKRDVIIKIAFSDKMVEYTKSDMEDCGISLAYAITSHKSQGSEFETIIMPIIPEHKYMLNKNIIYTSITRAKSTVYLFGCKQTFINQSQILSAETRNTFLAARMKNRENKYKLRNQSK